MADPLSITASVLAVVVAATNSARSLKEAVKRYTGRDKTLQRLRHELEDLTKILDSLSHATDAGETMLELLRGPIERCSQVCTDFETSMKGFIGESKTGLRDWARMEFMRGDINDFIDTIAGYKSTISVGLGSITIHASKVSQDVVTEYNELIQDTAYNLEIRLQRIDEKITHLSPRDRLILEDGIDLNNEKEVTQQCLRVCEDARSYLQTLSSRASFVVHGVPRNTETQSAFEGQLRTMQALDEAQAGFAETIGNLSRRLGSLVQNSLDRDDDSERQRLQSDVEMSKQCLTICNMANEISRQKEFRIGEVVAEGDSDQVVVTTLADLFDIGKALSKDNSAQLVGSMTRESLSHLTEYRYKSRFGANASVTSKVKTDDQELVIRNKTNKEKQSSSPQATEYDQDLRSGQSRPSSNETRKRAPGDA